MNWKLKYKVLDGEYERRGQEIKELKKIVDNYKEETKIINQFMDNINNREQI